MAEEDEMERFAAEIALAGSGLSSDGNEAKRRKVQFVAPDAPEVGGNLSAATVPDWQKALLERDRQLMQARRAENADAKAAVEAADRAASSKSGQWVWDKPSNSWIWKETLATNNAGASHGQGSTTTAAPVKVAADEDNTRKRKTVRTAGGEIWQDSTMEAWPENDFRIFVGDLAHDTTDQMLRTAFEKYESFNMSRVVKDQRSQRCKGYGFVSIGNPRDGLKAMREMNGKYVGSRPCKLRKSNWKDRALTDGKKSDLQLMKKFYRK